MNCSANAEATGSNPVEAPKSFLGLHWQILKFLNWWSHLRFICIPAVHIIHSTQSIPLQNSFNKNARLIQRERKMSLIRTQNVFSTNARWVQYECKTYSVRTQNEFNTNAKWVQYERKTYSVRTQNEFNTNAKRIQREHKMSSKRTQNVFSANAKWVQYELKTCTYLHFVWCKCMLPTPAKERVCHHH